MGTVALFSAHAPLVAGKDYYFDEGPMYGYFLSQTFHTTPLTSQQAEMLQIVRIGVVRPDQRIDHELTYERRREPFPLDPAKFSALADGTYFYEQGNNYNLLPIPIDAAIHRETYVKVILQGRQVIRAEIISSPSVNTKHYTYWPNGKFKNLSGYNQDQGPKVFFSTDFDEKTGEPIGSP